MKIEIDNLQDAATMTNIVLNYLRAVLEENAALRHRIEELEAAAADAASSANGQQEHVERGQTWDP